MSNPTEAMYRLAGYINDQADDSLVQKRRLENIFRYLIAECEDNEFSSRQIFENAMSDWHDSMTDERHY